MKRVTLNTQVRIDGERMQPGATVEIEDDKFAASLIKSGRGVPGPAGPIFAHEDEMTLATRTQAHQAIDAAEKAGGINDVAAREKAVERFRGFDQKIRPIITKGPRMGDREDV